MNIKSKAIHLAKKANASKAASVAKTTTLGALSGTGILVFGTGVNIVGTGIEVVSTVGRSAKSAGETVATAALMPVAGYFLGELMHGESEEEQSEITLDFLDRFRDAGGLKGRIQLIKELKREAHPDIIAVAKELGLDLGDGPSLYDQEEEDAQQEEAEYLLEIIVGRGELISPEYDEEDTSL